MSMSSFIVNLNFHFGSFVKERMSKVGLSTVILF